TRWNTAGRARGLGGILVDGNNTGSCRADRGRRGRKEAVSAPFDNLWGGLRLWGYDYDELAILGDLDPHVLHTRLTSGPDSLGDVGLPECGGGASHCDYSSIPSARRS